MVFKFCRFLNSVNEVHPANHDDVELGFTSSKNVTFVILVLSFPHGAFVINVQSYALDESPPGFSSAVIEKPCPLILP